MNKLDRQLPELLAARLSAPLPGPAIGPRYELESPAHRKRHYDPPPPGARQAAVLILLYPHQQRWHLPLTLRPAHLPDHAGQISLPGGAIEPGESSSAAAIREFHEELGAPGLAVRPLGKLSSIYVEVSNFRVDPWVGVADERPVWTPNPVEVEQLLEVPLEHLLDPANLGCHERRKGEASYRAPHFLWQNHRIWGATCAMLGELVTVLDDLLRK
jgi:8-oxo-dGTP pyrophosphatase MutT (NUDIX family)